jgi:hypothetical protein
MDVVIASIIVIAFVVAVLLVAAYGLFELSPFAHHRDQFHKPGERQNSPRLE